MSAWTYEGYWNTIIGAHRSASDAVREFRLASHGDLEQWLGVAEVEAWCVGGEGPDMPVEWATHHETALEELADAMSLVVTREKREKRLKKLVETECEHYSPDGETVEQFARFLSDHSGAVEWTTHETLEAAMECAVIDFEQCWTTDQVVDLDTGEIYTPELTVRLVKSEERIP